MFVQFISDRFSVRNARFPVGNESWHRDASIPYELFGSKIIAVYGGFVNLDQGNNSQYFSCVPGTHTEAPITTSGFDKIPNDDVVIYNGKKKVIQIKPGQGIFFNEKTVHEIHKRPLTVDPSYRIYTKFVISTEPINVFGDTLWQSIQDQGPMPLHISDNKGKIKITYPPMYSSNHPSVFPRMMDEFSAGIRPQFRKPSDREIQWVYRFMPSLRSASTPTENMMFPEYTEDEMNMFLPIKL
jgi:hypothetical protein